MLKILRNDFFIALLLLVGYMSTNPYTYGWDDQHLEIPILKHLIDPSLYKGDYYVESATKYFTSWLYPVLAKFITVSQVPIVYKWLFMISRYWMFFFVFRLWLLISGSRFTALCVSLTFFLLGRTDEFLYRSFCHEEFAFIFMFAGLYCFYRERYFVAALLFGLCVDIHAIYGLFPMLYMLTFLLFCHSQRFKMVFLTGIAFVIASLPFLCWQIPISISREVAHPVPASEWMPLYMLSCFQNFLFGGATVAQVFSNLHIFWENCAAYVLLTGLYLFHLAFNPVLRRDKKVHAIIGLSLVLLGVLYVFDYVRPSRFVVDLNMIRVEQYMRFFLMGYTTLWTCEQIQGPRLWPALAASVLVLALGTVNIIGLFFFGLTAIIFIVDLICKKPFQKGRAVAGMICILILSILLYWLFMELKVSPTVAVFWVRFRFVLAAMVLIFGILLFLKTKNLWLRRLLIIVPIVGTLIICVYDYYVYTDLVKTGPSGWQLQRNWVDMQLYVRDNTPKNAMVLAPYDMPMGGFRIHSERKVVVCYRDCGIIGFDYAAAVEWNNRIHDILPFKVFSQEGMDQAVMTAILKYKADYVVFMKYYGPQNDTQILKKIYQNEVFSLYQVI
jgi:hypothetical protein